MHTVLHGQIPDHDGTTLSKALAGFSASTSWNDLRVAVAYASVAGLLHLLEILDARHRGTFASRWLLGLDDYLTQPGVLRTCLALPQAEVRTASLLDEGRRFHPKLFMVSQNRSRSLACIGSSNLTLGGMKGNCEAFAAITAATARDIRHFSRTWDRIWQLGRPTTEADIDAYEAKYSERPHEWPEADDLRAQNQANEPEARHESRILTSDSPLMDPSLAKTCWIEVGKNTAVGRELEFKAEQALFFGLRARA